MTSVEPIRRLEDIKAIKKLLQDSPRNLLLFTMGINNGLRVGDLLRLQVKDVQDLRAGEVVKVKEQKTGKINMLVINKSTHKVLQSYLKSKGQGSDDYLFESRKGIGHITVSHANRLVKSWCKQVNLRGNYRSHTLRRPTRTRLAALKHVPAR